MTDNDTDERYDFGRNWAQFAENIDETNIQNVIKNLERLLPDMKGKIFLDIGSGIHS